MRRGKTTQKPQSTRVLENFSAHVNSHIHFAFQAFFRTSHHGKFIGGEGVFSQSLEGLRKSLRVIKPPLQSRPSVSTLSANKFCGNFTGLENKKKCDIICMKSVPVAEKRLFLCIFISFFLNYLPRSSSSLGPLRQPVKFSPVYEKRAEISN